jgi:hypothetical protein
MVSTLHFRLDNPQIIFDLYISFVTLNSHLQNVIHTCTMQKRPIANLCHRKES